MLRNVVIVGALLFAGVALAVVLNAPEAWPMLAMAALVLAGTVFERVHYRGTEVTDGPGQWEVTAERFRDDVSGRWVTVWFNATTGERRYVEQDAVSPP